MRYTPEDEYEYSAGEDIGFILGGLFLLAAPVLGVILLVIAIAGLLP